MIGIFDSWLGGIQSLAYLRETLPHASYLYLGDTKYVPYGDKDPIFLRERTFQCLHWLFAQGCTLVILACNTASAYAIRARQEQFPDKKVLSVTLPGIEAIVEQWYHQVGLLATAATVQSGLYPEMMYRHYPDYQIEFIPYNGSWLVELLEWWAKDELIMEKLLQIFWTAATRREALVLGSTHYPVLIPYLKQLFENINFINPAQEAAKKLSAYLVRHSEILLQKEWKVYCAVTADAIVFQQRMETLLGIGIEVKKEVV